MTNPKLNQAYANLLLSLKQTIEYWTRNELEKEKQEAFETIKEQYNNFLNNKVNMINFNIRSLITSVSKVNHPDIVYNEKQQAEVQRILALFNDSTHDIRKEIRQMQSNGVTEYYCPLPSTHTNEQSQASSSQSYSDEERTSSYDSRPGYNSQNHGQGYQTNSQQSNYQWQDSQQNRHDDSEAQDEWQDEYDEQSPFAEFFKTIKGMWNLHINKIPTTSEEFDKISKFYAKKIKRAEQELRRREQKVKELQADYEKNRQEWHNSCTVGNIDEEYRKECVRLAQEVDKARVQYQILDNQLNQRWDELKGEINQRITEYNMQYRYYLDLYNEINDLIQRRAIDVNRPYMNTGKTYIQMINEAIEFLNTHQNYNEVTMNIERDVTSRDKKYRSISQKGEQAYNEWRKCGDEYNEWYQNAKAKKDMIFAQINEYYANIEAKIKGKISDATSSYNAMARHLEELREKYQEFMEKYQELNCNDVKKRK